MKLFNDELDRVRKAAQVSLADISEAGPISSGPCTSLQPHAAPMERILDLYCAFLKGVIALCLAVMVVLVFGNVVLRYGFNSGITISEELSRWLLVWLTFLGAIVAVREHAHLGVDTLVRMLPPVGNASASSSTIA